MKLLVLLLASAAMLASSLCLSSENDKRIPMKKIQSKAKILLNDQSSKINLPDFLQDLKINGTSDCKLDFFCRAEKVLSKHLNKSDELLRNLQSVIKPDQQKCTVKGTTKISQTSFLEDLIKCTQKFLSRPTR